MQDIRLRDCWLDTQPLSTNLMKMYSLFFSTVNCYRLNLTSNAPVVLGATIVFKGELISDLPPGTEYRYEWQDNGIPTRRKVTVSKIK